MRSAVVRTDRYSSTAIAFHWIIAALVLFNLWLGLFHDSLPRDWKVMPVHKAMGITILVLSIARLAWRLGYTAPPLPSSVPRWERVSARTVEWIFYAALIILPLSGWMMVSGAEVRRPLDWFGLFPIPYLPVSRAAGGVGHEVHELLGYAAAALVVLHVLAALYHHLIARDSTLVRMLPILRRPNAS